MQRLGMLRALLTTTIDYAPNGDWRADLTAEHRSPLRSLGHDLIRGQQHEVDPWVDHDRSISTECGAKRSTRGRQLRDRRVYDTLDTELLVEVRHGIADVPRAPQTLADCEHFRIIHEQVLEP